MAEQETLELTVDSDYKNVYIEIDGTTVATQEIIEEITINFGCTDGTAPGFGATFSPHCDVIINSNEITGNANLSSIQLGKRFYVYCWYDPEAQYPSLVGSFFIEQPPLYTDDYQLTFSGEGMLGSVMEKTGIDYDHLSSVVLNPTKYEKGIITIYDALHVVQSQFGIAVNMPSSSILPSGLTDATELVLPMRKKFRKKNYSPSMPYRKRFVKITAREFLAGIAVMMGLNVLEFEGEISFVQIGNLKTAKYFGEDSFVADYEIDKMSYGMRSMYLKTYETTKDQAMVGVVPTTMGYFFESECDCNSVYSPSTALMDNPYDVNVECQWIGRSFEAFYFSGDIENMDSGDYDDATPIHNYPQSWGFLYHPSSWDFSGWNEYFIPGDMIEVHYTQKNTETQQETSMMAHVFIMDMVWNWHGTIDVQISSSYNGELAYRITPTRSTKKGLLRTSATTTTDRVVTIRIDNHKLSVSEAYNNGLIDSSQITILPTEDNDLSMIHFTTSDLV